MKPIYTIARTSNVKGVDMGSTYSSYGQTAYKRMVQDVACDMLAKRRTTRVEQQTWHAMNVEGNQMLVANELMNFHWRMFVMPETRSKAVQVVSPNLPWAEDHFKERIGRVPLNPPPSNEDWPFAMKGNQVHKDAQEHFAHTYPERFWPKLANSDHPNRGIRFEYGDLDDLVSLLRQEPTTRQAYLPVWFPEDTGAVDGQRLPCSLGYHFMVREGSLHLNYYMRSCDFVRHFNDDIYMAIRLAQWVRAHAFGLSDTVVMGSFQLNIASLHSFEGDKTRLEHIAQHGFPVK